MHLLDDAGGEFGLHAVHHDGGLVSSREAFESSPATSTATSRTSAV
jgi:hypothetical protein